MKYCTHTSAPPPQSEGGGFEDFSFCNRRPHIWVYQAVGEWGGNRLHGRSCKFENRCSDSVSGIRMCSLRNLTKSFKSEASPLLSKVKNLVLSTDIQPSCSLSRKLIKQKHSVAKRHQNFHCKDELLWSITGFRSKNCCLIPRSFAVWIWGMRKG